MNLPKIPGLPDGNMVTYALIAAAVLAVVYYLRHPQGQGEGEGEEGGGSLPYNPTPVEGGAAGQVAAYESSLSEQISHLREQPKAATPPASEAPASSPSPTGPPSIFKTPQEEHEYTVRTGQGKPGEAVSPVVPKSPGETGQGGATPPKPVPVGSTGQSPAPAPVGIVPGQGLHPGPGEARPLTGLGSVPSSPGLRPEVRAGIVGNPGSRINTGPSPLIPRKLSGNNVRRAA